MKVLVPEVATHVMEGGEGRNQEILSVDTHPNLPVLVSAGAGENRVVLWTLHTKQSEMDEGRDWLRFLAEFTAMTFENMVNIVRFSPCGRYLACGDSKGLVTILSLREEAKTWTDVQDERDLRRVHLRGHTMDIQDLAWSPDSLFCATAAMDNLVLVWDVIKCAELYRLKDHTHYAQGVSWSADGQLLATASFDETVRVYRLASKLKKLTACTEVVILKKPKLFADEFRAPTFSRRLAFSPNASSGLLVTPGGLMQQVAQDAPLPGDMTAVESPTSHDLVPGGDIDKAPEEDVEKKRRSNQAFVTHVFRVSSGGAIDTVPAASLQGATQPSLAVRFHPMAFTLREDANVEPWASLECKPQLIGCRFLFAVATIHAVMVYDTQHPHPIAIVDKLHYASYTDLAWSTSRDGAPTLIASSRDGCFSMIRFERGELGEPIEHVSTLSLAEGVQSPAGESDVPPSLSPCQDVSPKYEIVDKAKDESAGTHDGREYEDRTAIRPVSPSAVASPQQQKDSRNQSNGQSQPHEASGESDSPTGNPSKKRRVQPENLGLPVHPSPAGSEPRRPSIVEKAAINTLQPRRVRLENIQPM